MLVTSHISGPKCRLQSIEKLPSIEDRGQTDRLTVLASPLTPAYDPCQFPACYGHDPYTCNDVNNKGQRSVGSKDRVETNGQTDATDCNTFLVTRSVITSAFL